MIPAYSPAGDIKIEGRVFAEFGPLAGAEVQVFKTYEQLRANSPYLTSSPANEKGSYSLQLEPGTYYFIATGKDGEKNFSAYHGANPLRVGSRNLWISLMAHQVKQPVYTDGETSAQGVVLYKGKPVQGAHVAFYTMDARKFKGLGFLADKGLGFMQAVDEDGTFNVRLVPDKYVVIARSIAGGNEIRPLRKGDLFCYIPSNPIEVKPGKKVRIEIPCYPKADRLAFVESPEIKNNNYVTLEDSANSGAYGIKGKVTDSRGLPVAEAYVIAYRTGDAATPTREAENITRTDADGNYFIPLDVDGSYGLVVRDTLGAAPRSNDMAGLYGEDPWQGISFKAGQMIDNINISIPDADRKLFE
ncbi:MAG: carboxypeptidase-like regulatory domain-containing protein [Desulfobulbaceae bacterium]|nr:carboxypeptidase-like regulatory domain-containing protein [Desulfobulbaceae bacterium]